MSKSVLVIDDNLTICLMLKSWLQKKDFNVQVATGVDQAKQMIKEHPFDLVLTDIRMPDSDGFALLSWVKKYDSEMVVIMMTGYADIESAVESMKAGAADYIAKPIEPELLFKKIDEAFIAQENTNRASRLMNDFVKPPGERYQHLFELLTKVSQNNEHLLVIGDRGTGKASSVKFIYERGIHPTKPLKVYDGSQPEKGGSDQNGAGSGESSLMMKFNEAKGGMLYIKELDQLNLSLQDEVLSLLTRQSKSGEYTQIILSSEKPKEELKNILIPKLYNLIEKNAAVLPTLKGRKEEIKCLTLYFLDVANHILNKEVTRIDPELQKAIMEHDWPQNIQELKNCIIKAVLMTEGTRLEAGIIPSLFNKQKQAEKEKPVLMDAIHRLRKENYEKEKIQQALELAKGNKTMAASILNIDRKTLYNKIKLYNVTLQ